jgi:preprotein translocase subunit SecG
MSFCFRIFETMSFVYPGFLFALSVISIPIIIHLIQLRKYKKIYFSNVSFLHSIEEQQRNTNKLKHLLVLLARILSILFLVLAFAQPFIPKNNKQVTFGKKYVSVYVDNSYSMERQTTEGTLLNDAKRKAKEIALTYSINDQFQLLSNEFSGNQQRWLNRENFLQSLAELKIRPEVRTFQEVCARQSSMLKEKAVNNANAFMISDFQQSFINYNNANNLDTLINWQFIVLESKRNENISIDSVWFYSPIHLPGLQESLLIKIKNHSSTEVADIPYEILLNEQVIGVGNVSIDAESFTIDTFKFKNKGAGYQAGSVKLKDQSLTFDNQYYFAYNVERSRNIAIIKGSEATSYAEAVFKTEPFFSIKTYNYLQVDYAYLNSCDVIILDEVNEFSSGLLSEIEKQLKAAKVIVSFPSAQSNLNVNDFNTRFGLAKNTSVQKINERIEKINQNSNLFKDIFLGQQNSRFDLPNVQAYLPFNKQGGSPEVLIELANSQSLLNRYTIGEGVVYQFAFPLNPSFSDLPKHALVVPMMLRIGTIHHGSGNVSFTIGSNSSLELRNSINAEKVKKELRKGEYAFIPEIRNVNGSYRMYVADQIKEPGVYEYRLDGVTSALFAFNADRKESDMLALSTNELKNKIGEQAKIWKPGDASISKFITDRSFESKLWKICVILALFFMGLEILLIRFGDRYLQQKK